jgi:hypothetical protein
MIPKLSLLFSLKSKKWGLIWYLREFKILGVKNMSVICYRIFYQEIMKGNEIPYICLFRWKR